MNAALRASIESDIGAIVSDIRAADAAEMAALGTTPERAMREGMGRSDWSVTGLIDDVPVCMFGVAPVSIILGRGAPWMLASNALDRLAYDELRREFLPRCHAAVRVMREDYPFLFNVVHSRNRKAIRWLRLLGFNFGASPVRIGGADFLVFAIGDSNV